MTDGSNAAHDPRFLAGLRYHYLGRYWDSHFILEKLWLTLEGEAKRVVQVLIMAGAATIHVHWQRWDNVSALCDRALERLKDCPDRYQGLDLKNLAAELKRLRDEAKLLAKGRKSGFDPSLIPSFALAGVNREALMSDARFELPTEREEASAR